MWLSACVCVCVCHKHSSPRVLYNRMHAFVCSVNNDKIACTRCGNIAPANDNDEFGWLCDARERAQYNQSIVVVLGMVDDVWCNTTSHRPTDTVCVCAAHRGRRFSTSCFVLAHGSCSPRFRAALSGGRDAGGARLVARVCFICCTCSLGGIVRM